VFFEGNGTIDNPYLIASASDFFNIRNFSDAHFKQVADINMANITWADYPGDWSFRGSYDGNGFKIKNFKFGTANSTQYGLFGRTQQIAGADRVKIKNVTVVDSKLERSASINNGTNIGFLAATAEYTDFENCSIYRCKVDFKLSKIYRISAAGGICGSAHNCNIIDCISDVDMDIQYADYVGGICGRIYGSTTASITRCRTSGKLEGDLNNVGGISGDMTRTNIYRCTTNMTIKGSGVRAGGMTGWLLSGGISESYSNAIIDGKYRDVSPFIGNFTTGMVTDCYCNGVLTAYGEDIAGANVGGIVGAYSASGTGATSIINCYSTCDLIVGLHAEGAVINIGGIVGSNFATSGASIKQCFALMRRISTYEHQDSNVGRIWGYKEYETSSVHTNFALNIMTYMGGDFPEANKIHNGKDGADITLEQAQTKETYTTQNWNFVDIWGIKEGYNNGLPFLRAFGEKEENEMTDEPYPVVYNEDEEDFSGFGLTILENAYNVKIRKVINGEYTLSLTLPRSDPKWEYIKLENVIKVERQLFRIRSFDEIRDSQGNVVSNIQCEHVWYDANTCKHIPYLELINANARTVLETIFADTPFTVDKCEIETYTDIFLNKSNPVKATAQLIENIGGELEIDNYKISIVNKLGKNNGVQFRVGKNVNTIKRNVDSRELVTRLYPYGKDGLEINGSYIDSPLSYLYSRPRIAYKDYRDIDNKTDLLNAALAELSTEERDGIDKPKVTYACEVVELKKLKEYGDFEKFDLGDTVRVIDENLGIDTLQRIIEYEYYPYEAKKSKVILANYDVKKYVLSTPSGMLGNLMKSNEQFNNMLYPSGMIDTSYLDFIREKISTEINAALHKAVIYDRGIVLVDNVENPTKAIAIISGSFAIANSKKANGDWNWRTIATGDKVVADEVAADWIYSGVINANQIYGGTLSGVSIDIDTDAVIGNALYIGNQDNARDKKIIFSNANAGKARISYLSGDLDIIADGHISLNAQGGVYVNGQRID